MSLGQSATPELRRHTMQPRSYIAEGLPWERDVKKLSNEELEQDETLFPVDISRRDLTTTNSKGESMLCY